MYLDNGTPMSSSVSSGVETEGVDLKQPFGAHPTWTSSTLD